MITVPTRGLALVFLLAASSAAGHAQGVFWNLVPNECRGPAEQAMAESGSGGMFGCGALGAFLVSGLEAEIVVEPSCRLGGGFEEPPAYARMPPGQYTSPRGWTPCAEGSCFEAAGTSGPWVAVLDWNDVHGWSVGELVLQASDGRLSVSLIDLLGARDDLPVAGPRVTDLDVLAQLCSVAELVHQEPAARPLAVNMSFGRVRGDEVPCGSPAKSSIACQVRAVLDHLSRDLDVVPVAAAGNHGEMLFPASHPAVVSAGSLELASFANQRGFVEPSMETPPGSEALVPGYGLSLRNPDQLHDEWPVPAGSSYASALTTGWIAGSLHDGLLEAGLDPSGRWYPVTMGERFGLAFEGVPIPGSDLHGASALVSRALGRRVKRACRTGDGSTETWLPLAVGAEVTALPEQSVVDLETDGGPLPGTRPCIPCQGDDPPPEPPDGLTPTGDLLLHMGSSLALPSELALHEVYLRAGPRVYELVPLEGSAAVFRQRFASGDLDELHISGLAGLAGPQDQLSVVFLVSHDGSPPVWDAVPIAVYDPGDSSCEDSVLREGL